MLVGIEISVEATGTARQIVSNKAVKGPTREVWYSTLRTRVTETHCGGMARKISSGEAGKWSTGAGILTGTSNLEIPQPNEGSRDFSSWRQQKTGISPKHRATKKFRVGWGTRTQLPQCLE